MPRLVVLNGPPGIGKSTLARRYVDEHAEALDLDIDELSRVLWGPGLDFSTRVGRSRTLALVMAGAWLADGHDVVAPQFVGRVSQLERFESVAATNGATFVHVVLLDSRASSLERFARRGATARDEHAWAVHEHVATAGGASLLSDMYDSLAEVVRARLTSVLLPSRPGMPDHTYRLLVQALGEDHAPPPPRAVAVVVDAGRVLVVRRRRLGVEYAVLPGGGVEAGETPEHAALRELGEETGLVGRVQRRLWERADDGRAATYWLMTDVVGTPVLGGDEASENSPDNSFVLDWVAAGDLEDIRLQPAALRLLLPDLLAELSAR